MNKVPTLLLIFFSFFVATSALTQNDTLPEKTKEKKYKAKKYIKIAFKRMKKGNIYAASDLYEEILTHQPENVSVMHNLATSYYLARDYKSAERWYKRVTELDPVSYQFDYYQYALMMKMNAKYEKAIPIFEKFRKTYNGEAASTYKKWAKNEIDGCELAQQLIEDPLPLNLYHLDNAVNSAYTDISPVIWDDTTLLFASLPSDTVIVFEGKATVDHYIKLYKSAITDDSYQTSEVFSMFNEPGFHVANGAFSPGKDRFYFTKCQEIKKGKIVCAIHVSEYKENHWQEPEALSININDPASTSTHPAIAPYKKGSEILYFVSDREGGKGRQDIWYSTITRKGEYKDPKNLGTKINTDKDEATPYYDASTGSLYFSSNGKVNIGGFDVFKSEGSGSRWATATNVGYPINSSTDDMYFKLKQGGQAGFVVSNRPGIISIRSETCCDDIFSFEYVNIIKVAVQGLVYDEEDSTKTPLSNAQVALSLRSYDGIESDIEINNGVVEDGKPYFFNINADEDYKVTGSADGFLTSSSNFDTKDLSKSDTLNVDIYLRKLVKDKAYRLKNIYYDFDKWALRDESKGTLDTLYNLLVENPTIIIELSSHTDTRGSDSYNKNLSQKRAESCVNYLISNGIGKERMTAKGYGESRLLDDCAKFKECPNDNVSDCPCHQLNRRTEFKVIGELDAKLIYEDERFDEDEAENTDKRKSKK